MIYDFQSAEIGDGVFDFGGSIIVAALFVHGCVHVYDYEANAVDVRDYAANIVGLQDYRLTIVGVSDEAC